MEETNSMEVPQMDLCIGVKEVLLAPMTRGEYNTYRGWDMPKDENPNDKGYLVEYLDSPNQVHPNHANYISWSPKKVADNAYRKANGATFGLAIEAAKKGKKIARRGWNGKDMFVFLREGRQITGVNVDSPMGGDFESRSHLCMKDAQGKCVVGWLASQTDILADDWFIVN